MYEDATAQAARFGAQDVLVLRRLRPGEWFHTSGVGRPAGWAGALVESDAEPLLARAVAGGVVRVLATSPTAVVGPYWATTAALVPVGADTLVAWGHPGRSAALVEASDVELQEASRTILAATDLNRDDDGRAGDGQAGDRRAGEVGRLAQELQVLAAVQTLTGSLDQPLEATLHRVAEAVASTLDVVGVAVWLGDGRSALVGLDGAPFVLWEALVPHLGPVGTGVLVPARRHRLPVSLAPRHGIGDVLLLTLDVPGGGGLAAAHAVDRPGAFSDLHRRIADQLVGTAGTVLQVVLARERVERQLSDTKAQLGRDTLTSAGSRHRWDVELAAAQELVDAGEPVCVALLDLDDLKWVNDTHGHAAGDELLRVCADAVRKSLRGGSDVVARVGGDEFGVLVPRATDAIALGERLRRGVEAARTSFGVALRVSVGVARCEPGEDVGEAFAAADAAMYEDKRGRRAARGLPPRAQAGVRS